MSGSAAGSGFDRLRPRAPLPDVDPAAPPELVAPLPPARKSGDGQGRRALFSVTEPALPAFGSVTIDCSACQETSVLTLRQALRLAIPSVYLPVIRRRYPAWLHCPACGDWTWTRVRLRL